MKAEALIEKERERVEGVYVLTIQLASFAIAYVLLTFGLEICLWKGWLRPLNLHVKGKLIGMAIMGMTYLLYMRYAIYKNQAHQLVATETIPKIATRFEGDAAEWSYPSNRKLTQSNLIFALILAGATSALVGMARNEYLQFFSVYASIASFSAVITGLVFIPPPRLRIDEKGIAGFRNLFGRAQAPWSKIAICEIERFHNKKGEDSTRWFYFRSASGELLLMLTPWALLGLTTRDINEIETEIRRRLTGNNG